ncbi:MAG: hypothetical protein ABIR77_07935, partial [Sphingomicrobium sp.]
MAELCGAAALGGGAGAAAWLVAPLTGITPGLLAAGGTVIGALGGWAIVHAVPQGGARQALPEFSVEP